MSDSTIITLRLPQSLVDRADTLIEPLSESEEALFLGRVSRSIVLRLAVLRGLEALEAQAGQQTTSATTTATRKKTKRAQGGR